MAVKIFNILKVIRGYHYLSGLMLEFRWHGRGGQGVWTGSNLLALAAMREGKYIQSFPEFGPERSGAPVKAFTRISSRPITLHCHVYNPDYIVILDPTLLETQNLAEGLKPGGKIIVNHTSPDKLKQIFSGVKAEIWWLPATDLAVKTLGRGITNTAMLGATIKIAPEAAKLESVIETVRGRFKGEAGEKNVELVEKAYKEVKRVE